MATRSEPTTGTILGIRDCGAIVVVFLDAEEGRVLPVVCSRRLLCDLLQTAGCNPDQLMGRTVSYDGESLFFVE